MTEGRIFKAGAAERDITPPLGTQLAGTWGIYCPTRIVYDRIYARVLILEDGERKLCIVSLDLCFVTRRWTAEIRQRAAAEFDLEPEAILVHATQNHAAPTLGGSVLIDEEDRPFPEEYTWLYGDDERYCWVVVEEVLAAMGDAIARMEPAQVGVGSGIEGRVAFNRRYRMRDGSTRTHPPIGDPDILYREGPIDPELGVVYIANKDATPVAMLLHHTCHPCHFNVDFHIVSGGWPGAWAREIKATYGAECVPLVLNGCCGNIHHRNHLSVRHVDSHLHMGRMLAETTHSVVKRLQILPPRLDCRSTIIQLPLRTPDEADLAAAKSLIAEHPQPQVVEIDGRQDVAWDWMYAVSLLSVNTRRERDPLFDYEVQAFRIGDLGLIAVGGEPFVDAQLAIKLASPAPFTYMAHMSNASAGYVPTAEALVAGGYETRMANWSKFAPEALDLIVNTAVDLLQELFPERPQNKNGSRKETN